jgi:hypothetical protein
MAFAHLAPAYIGPILVRFSRNHGFYWRYRMINGTFKISDRPASFQKSGEVREAMRARVA